MIMANALMIQPELQQGMISPELPYIDQLYRSCRVQPHNFRLGGSEKPAQDGSDKEEHCELDLRAQPKAPAKVITDPIYTPQLSS